MEILGIGPLEFIFIIFIALIILGPNDMVKAGRTIGRFLRKIVTSSEWRTIQQASKELRYLPNRLIREAGLEELKNGLNAKNMIGSQIGLDELKNEYDQWKQDISSWTTPPEPLADEPENNIESDQDIDHKHKNDLEETEHK
jgi:Sec-independent protein translocase protein TatA